MSQSKIYVGNLSYDTTEDDLNGLFNEYGTITETKLIADRVTGRSRGFAFVTYEDAESAEKSLTLDGTEFQGRRLKINIAKDDKERRSGGGNGGGKKGGRRW